MDVIKDYQEIARVEKVELDLKIHYLTRAMRTSDFEELPFMDCVLMMLQLAQMKSLSDTLERRIEMFK